MADLQEKSLDKTTDAWNVAQGYTMLKILKPLVEMDKLVKISLYGTENIEESTMIPPETKTITRIEAINRLIDVLRETIENADFAMGEKTKSTINELENKTIQVQKVINGISYITKDHRTGEQRILINEEHFTTCLEELRKIKKSLPDPLNKERLIFPGSDEIDLDKLQNRLINSG